MTTCLTESVIGMDAYDRCTCGAQRRISRRPSQSRAQRHKTAGARGVHVQRRMNLAQNVQLVEAQQHLLRRLLLENPFDFMADTSRCHAIEQVQRIRPNGEVT